MRNLTFSDYDMLNLSYNTKLGHTFLVDSVPSKGGVSTGLGSARDMD